MLTLTYYNLRRLAKHRALLVALILLPLLFAITRLVFARAEWLMWMGLGVCALATAIFFCLQHRDDANSNLLTALHAAPLAEYTPAASRLISGLLVFALQASLFFLISTL